MAAEKTDRRTPGDRLRTVREMRMTEVRERMQTLVFEALGQASMCWDDVRRAGVFRSDEARAIGDRLTKKIDAEILEAYGHGFLDAAKEAEQRYADQHADKQPGVPQDDAVCGDPQCCAQTDEVADGRPDLNGPVGSGDVVAWARFWKYMIAQNPTIPTDEGAMISWFANVAQDCIDVANRQHRDVEEMKKAEAGYGFENVAALVDDLVQNPVHDAEVSERTPDVTVEQETCGTLRHTTITLVLP